MSWTNPPDLITSARDAIKACASATTLGVSSDATWHYPDAGLKTTALPFAILTHEPPQVERHAQGESYARGTVEATLYLSPATLTTGQAETALLSLARELCEQTTGLFITGAVPSLASRVRRSKTAGTVNGDAREYFTLSLSLSWEG